MNPYIDKLANLPLEVSGHSLAPLQQATAKGWTRHTTVVRLAGLEHVGLGEDVTYDTANQRAFQHAGACLSLAGRYTLEGFSHRLDELDLFNDPPGRPDYRLYRRWAFESAALDLALQQAGRSLAEALGQAPRPVTFVASLGLGSPPSTRRVEDWLEHYPNLRFKVDLGTDWTDDTTARLAALDVVDVVDLKGLYRGSFTGPPADPDNYRRVANHLPNAILEDPELTQETRPILEPHFSRVAWDANIHSLADVEALPFEPRYLNIKPSRFGRLSELFRTYAYLQARDMVMYGGGQFELGPGRGQLQCLASLFHADGPNDVAPVGFNEAEVRTNLPVSPLVPGSSSHGFGWQTATAR